MKTTGAGYTRPPGGWNAYAGVGSSGGYTAVLYPYSPAPHKGRPKAELPCTLANRRRALAVRGPRGLVVGAYRRRNSQKHGDSAHPSPLYLWTVTVMGLLL